MDEIAIYEEVQHPYAMKVIEYFKTKQTIFIVVEYFEGKLLTDYLMEFPNIEEDEIIEITKQLLTLANYLHGKKIVNRNITLRNIMYNGDYIKITNFHRARKYKSGERLNDILSGVFYRAPEMIKRRYNSRVDVWAIGVVTYILLTGESPFEGSTEKELHKNILETGVDLEKVKDNGASDLARDFITQIFTKSKNKRPKADMLLQHPWICSPEGRISKFKIGNQFLENLRTFHFKSEFQKAIYSFLVTKLASEYDRQVTAREFQKLDTDNNGVLTKSEIVGGLKRMSISVTDNEALNIFDKMDAHKKGVIEYNDFLEAFIDRKKFMEEENLRMCYDFIDTSKSNSIMLKDLEKIFGEMTKTNYVKSMFNKYAKKGFINKESFIKMLRNISE